MGKRSNGDGGRFSRSGHTSHGPRPEPSTAPDATSFPSAPPIPPPPPHPAAQPPSQPYPPSRPAADPHARTDYVAPPPPYDDRGYPDPRGEDRYYGPPRRDGGYQPPFDPHYQAPHYQAPHYEAPHYQAPHYEAPHYQAPHYDDPYYERRYAPRPDSRGYADPRYPAPDYDSGHPTPPPPAAPPPAAPRSARPEPYPPGRAPTGPVPDRPTDYLSPGERPTSGGYGTRELPAAAVAAGAPAPAAGAPAPGVGTGAGDPLDPAVAPGGPPGAPKVTVTRAVGVRGKQAAQAVTRKIVAASQADGAKESGLTPLIWNQVLSYGTDAMITVALAGTVFFGASQDAQKGNVLTYLLVTMAPFAIVAPIIGPALDRLQHGRRWALAGTAFGRALLAILMAANFDNLLVLFPLALGSLVLSKAYSVVRAAAAPRVVPPEMTLVSANARLSIFGLAAAIIGGGFIALVIKSTQSYPFALWLTAVAFAVTGYFALRLPALVDSATPSSRHPEEAPRPTRTAKVPPTSRIREWVSRGFEPHVIIAIQGASLLRWATGFLTLFFAFYIQRTSHGFDAAAALGAIGLGVGLGNFVGTAAGARLKLARPDKLVTLSTIVTTASVIFAAATFSLTTSVICMAIASAMNSLGKLSLDAVVQHDVAETLRSSAFARSETFLQLAWVFGAAVALLLPSDQGTLGLSLAAAFLTVGTVVIVLRARAMGRNTQRGQQSAPGTV